MTDKTADRNLTASLTASLASARGRESRARGGARPWKPVFPTGRLVAVAENIVITTATIMPKARMLTISTATRRRKLEISNDRAHCVARATDNKKYAPSHKVFFTRKRIAL